MEIPRWNQAVNLSWLLLCQAWGSLKPAVACSRGFRRLFSMSQAQPFVWKNSLGGPVSRVGQSLGISKAGQTVLARLMETQIWHQLTHSVGGRFRKRTLPSACFDARHFNFSLYTTGAFQAATLVLELRGSEYEKVGLCVGFLRRTAWCSRSFFHWLTPCWFLQPEMGTYPTGTGTLGWRAGLLTPVISLPNFYPPHVGVGPALSTSASLLSVWMDVVSLILYLSDFHSNRFHSCQTSIQLDFWWFWVMVVVILLWLWEEASHVCLCCHLDWNSGHNS